MKIKNSVLKQIIREELNSLLKLIDVGDFEKENQYDDNDNDNDNDDIMYDNNTGEECGEDEFFSFPTIDDEPIHSSVGGGRRKQPSDYLSGGDNKKSVDDRFMMNNREDSSDLDNDPKDSITLRWQQLAESKRR